MNGSSFINKAVIACDLSRGCPQQRHAVSGPEMYIPEDSKTVPAEVEGIKGNGVHEESPGVS